MISIRTQAPFLVESSQDNVLNIPQFQYKESTPDRTLRVLNVHYAPPEETGKLHVQISLRYPYLLKVSHGSGQDLSIIVGKLNKAYRHYCKNDAFALLPDDSIQVLVDQGEIFTNFPCLLRKKYESADDISQTALPFQTFLCYNATPAGEIEEPSDLRESQYYTEPVLGEYVTEPVTLDLSTVPNSIIFGFMPSAATEEKFVFPLTFFSTLFPTTPQTLQLSQEISRKLNSSRHAERYGWNFDVFVQETSEEFMCGRNTTDKVEFKSWFHIYEAEPKVSPIYTAAEWPDYLKTYLDIQMIIPPVKSFLVPYQNPLSLHIGDGIENSALLRQNYEKVIALMEINSGAVNIIFTPQYPLNSPYALNRIPLELKDSLGRKIPGDLKVHIALT